MNPLNIFIDLEALGRKPGSAIIQIGAVAFDIGTGKAGSRFHRHVAVHPALHVEQASVLWHAKHGTWPLDGKTPTAPLEEALEDLSQWIADLGTPASIWSWGSTYDFPLLDAAYEAAGAEPRWRYWQEQCARSVWRLAFPDTPHGKRPHHALEDALAGVADLMAALRALHGNISPATA